MTIADGKYAAEVITEKGRVYKFDDIMCMVHYGKENSNTKMAAYYVNDYTQDNVLIPAKTAFFISGGTIQSPMRGGIIAFSSENDTKEFGIKLKAKPVTWEAVITK
jgi:copper chaperone NosL